MIAASLLYYAPAIIAPRLAALGIVILLSHRLAPDHFGYFTLVLLVGEMLEIAASNWIRVGLLRLDSARPERWRAAITRSGHLTSFSTMIATLGAGVAAYLLVPHTQWLPFAGAAAGYILTNAFLRLGLTALQLQHQRLSYAVVEGGRAILMFAAVALALSLGIRNYWALTWVIAATTAAAAAVALVRVGYNAFGKGLASDREDLLDRLKFGGPIIVLLMLSYAVTSTDRLALQLLSGPAQVGVYAAAYALARQPIDVLATSLNQGGFPELVRRFERDGAAAAGQLSGSLLSAYVLVLCSTAVVLGCLAGPVAKVLLPHSYVPIAERLIPVIASAAVLLNLKTCVFDNIFHVARKNWLQCLSFVPAAAAVVLVCIVLIPALGGLGAATAMLLGAVAGLAGSVLLSRGLLKVEVEVGELLKAVAVAVAAGVAAFTAVHVTQGGPLLQLASGCISAGLGGGVLLLLLQPKAIAGFVPARLRISARAARR